MKTFLHGSFLVVATIALSSPLRADSLWTKETNNERGMFADSRAKNVGDILTIVVQESTTATQTQETTTFKESKPGALNLATNLINQFIAGIPAIINAQKPIQLPTGQSIQPPPKPPSYFPNITVPPLDTAGKDEYRGGGTITNKQTVTNRTAVTVVDVLPNGNMVIEGTKVIAAGKDTQYAYLRGIIRAADVLKDNTVLSTNIADSRIEFIPEGTLTDAQKKGWLLRLNDRIKPY